MSRQFNSPEAAQQLSKGTPDLWKRYFELRTKHESAAEDYDGDESELAPQTTEAVSQRTEDMLEDMEGFVYQINVTEVNDGSPRSVDTDAVMYSPLAIPRWHTLHFIYITAPDTRPSSLE